MLTEDSVRIKTLGDRAVRSPLNLSTVYGDGKVNFAPDESRVRHRVMLVPGEHDAAEIEFEAAGPRERIYFEPARTRAAIVTCGGLCPGLNNVIRSIVLELHFHYGVTDVLGIRYGYRGLSASADPPPMPLTPTVVADIHKMGGSLLGCSRGPGQAAKQVDFLVRRGVNLLFCVGGDGTQRGAHAIAAEALQRGAPLAVIGIPKTIDNDIMYVWRTFGYYTAMEKACEVLQGAHVEANCAVNGIALVKLMGREAGFIAAGATIGNQDVNFTLIPEIPFVLDGPGGFLEALEKRILDRQHAVIVVAEGAGQHLIPLGRAQRDASGNVRYRDVGEFLKNRIIEYFKRQGIPTSLKYFDPSYFIRSVPANCDDSLLCDALARHAVHAAMAGKTDMLVGLWYNCFTHVPIDLAVAEPKRVSPESRLWQAVLSATGQPQRFGPA